jgi:hypothetical protein
LASAIIAPRQRPRGPGTSLGEVTTQEPSQVGAARPAPGVTSRSRFGDPNGLVDRFLIPLGLFALAWAAYAWINHARSADLDYFVPLADAFLHGRLGLTEAPSYLNELVPAANGLYYVVYPPAPALLVLPAVWIFGTGFEQAWASILFGALNVVLASTVIRAMGVSRVFRIVLSLVFAFGTIVWYSAQAGSSWHFAHVAAMLFTLLAIRACQRDLHPVLIGLLFAGAVFSRLTVMLAAPFFLAYFIDRAALEGEGDRLPFGHLAADRPPFWRTRVDLASLFEGVSAAAAALVAVAAVYLLYDDLRFGSPLQNGYALIPGLLQEDQYRHGFFSVVNIPRTLYALLLSSPNQVGDFPWVQSRRLGGLSIVLTTPLFLWAIKARRPDWFGVGCWLAVVLVLGPILLHADPGGAQFGFRYAQDVYPFLLLLTIRGLGGRISFEAWAAIVIGFVVNLWGMGSTYFDWWA